MRWSLMIDRSRPKPKAATDPEAMIAKATTIRTARAWVEREQLQEIAERMQTIAVATMLIHWSMASGRA